MLVRIRNFEHGMRLCWWVLLAVVIGLIVLIRIRLLPLSLERDEGEYAYAGQLMLQGIPPYQLAYNMKFPGVYAAYALVMSIFGRLCSGFYFRQHYFIFILSAICFLVGGTVASASNFCSQLARPLRFLPLAIFGAATTFALFAEWETLLWRPSSDAARMIYGGNPFPEAVRVAQYLREHSNPTDTIAILGSEPEIYFYAHRHSATGYIYTYGLMEPQRFAGRMQHEMMREVEAARPKYLVVVAVAMSWLRWPNSDTAIFDWIDRYTAEEFRLDGLVNILSRERTDYYLPLSVDPGSIQLSQYYLLIFKRKT